MLDRICLSIKDQLSQVDRAICDEISSGMETVDSIANYVIQNGGKRIRPVVFLLSAKMAGAPVDGLPRLSAALEMLHTASLLHDDVIDDAQLRRGKPSARSKWGNQISVLVGDFFLSRASKILVEKRNPHLMEVVADAISSTTEGELLEIIHQNDTAIDEAVYLKIIQGKTAALFSLASRAGAIVAELSKSFENALGSYGFEVGQAFQLADDALDYSSDEKQFGKQAGTDLKGGKLTYPLIVAITNSNASEKVVIRDVLIAGNSTPDQFSEIYKIIKKYGGIEATITLARECSIRAKEHLSVFKPSIERDSLMMLSDYAVSRQE